MSTVELWNFREDAMGRLDLAGFKVEARDGAIGKVARTVRGPRGGYLVVEPGVVTPVRRYLLVPSGLVERVHTGKHRVSLGVAGKQVMNAPAYDPAKPPADPPSSEFGDYFRSLRQRRTRTRAARPSGSRRSSTKRQSTPRRTRTARASQQRSRSRGRTSEQPTREELYEQAKRLDIEGRSKMTKAQLARAVGRRKGQSSRPRSSARTPANPVAVQSFLDGVGYPTGKRKLVREAERKRASKAVRETLRRLPERQFKSPTEVSKAIGKLG